MGGSQGQHEGGILLCYGGLSRHDGDAATGNDGHAWVQAAAGEGALQGGLCLTVTDEDCQLIRSSLPGRFIQQGLVDEGLQRSDITQRLLIPLLTTAFQGRKRLCGGLHHGDADRR